VATLVLKMNCTPLSKDVALDDNNQSYFYHTLRPYSLCDQEAELAWGIPMLTMYGLAFPLCLSAYILRSTHATQLTEEFNGRLDVRFLFSMYKPKHTWWVAVVFLRRFLLPVCIQAFSYHNHNSTFCLFAILAVSAVVGAYVRPFIRQRDNVMDALSLMTLVVTYFFAALRQANSDGEHSGAAATAIVVLVLNVLTMLALAVCLCLDFKWVIPLLYRKLFFKKIAEPVDMPVGIEAHDNPIHLEHRASIQMMFSVEEAAAHDHPVRLLQEGGVVEMIDAKNRGMEGLAHDNQYLIAQLEALKADHATLKASHLTKYAALNVENEGLRRRLVVVDQLPMSEMQEGLR
jgi:hypothetical protein